MVGKANSVIDLMFLCSRSSELNNHFIYPDWRLSSNHVSIIVSIPIAEENIAMFKFFIAKNSEEEESFIKEDSYTIKSIDVSNLSDINKLKNTTNSLTSIIEYIWKTSSKQTNIMRHFKS